MPNPAYDILQLTAMLSVRQGIDGYSPSITVKEDSESNYVLTIANEEGSFNTPNLIPERLVKAVEKKVDKVEGKDLSTNDFTNEYKDKLENLHNYDDSVVLNRIQNQERSIQTLQENKVVNNMLTIESSNWVQFSDGSIPPAIRELCQATGYNYCMRNNSGMPSINVPSHGTMILFPYTNNVYTMQQMISGNICPYCVILYETCFVLAKELPTQTITLHCTYIQ